MDLRRRSFLPGLGAMLVAPASVRAQTTRLPTVGILSTRSFRDSAYLVDALERGIYEAGFEELRRVKIQSRWAEGRYARLPELANELVRARVDVLAAVGGEPSVLAARKAAARDAPRRFAMPFLFVVGNDPVELGLVESLARPSGDATGLVIHTLAIGPKRLDLLRQVVPAGTTFGALLNPDFPAALFYRRELEEAVRSLGLTIRFAEASNENQLTTAFDALAQQGVGALLVQPDPFFDMVGPQLVALAAARRWPALYHHREYTMAGGLMSYGINLSDVYRTIGRFAGLILKGEAPSDLPVQRLDNIEYVLNLRTARALGLKVPPALTGFANELLE
jgi:putative ABC transport system substrate-binding protein